MITPKLLVDAKLTDQDTANKIADSLNEACERFNISSNEDVAMFLAQASHESGHFKTTSEGLNYKVQALMSLFGRHRISEDDCKRFGRIDGGQQANQEAIANAIYGGEFGRKNLGNTEEGDGFKFRGAGYFQLTGRANFQAFANAIDAPEIMENPRLVCEPKFASLSAGWFWDKNKLGQCDGNVEKATKIINGGQIGIEDRKHLYAQAIGSMVA